MAIKDYSEELPKAFKTWLQFWDMLCKMELQHHLTVKQIKPKQIPVKLIINRNDMPESDFNEHEEVTYLVSYVKEMAFEELLAERVDMTKDEILNFIRICQEGTYYVPDQDREAFKDILRSVKRILLTQAKKN